MTGETLKEWYVRYRKNRDIILRKIENISDKGSHILIKNKNGTEEIGIVHEDVSSILKLLEPFDKKLHIITVVLNKKAHMDILLEEWDKLIEYTQLTVMFVNPGPPEDKKWIIKPAIHDRVTERAALKKGIMSIAEAVELS
jgi:hypothetical protein